MSEVSKHLRRLARQYNVMWIMCREHFRSDGESLYIGGTKSRRLTVVLDCDDDLHDVRSLAIRHCNLICRTKLRMGRLRKLKMDGVILSDFNFLRYNCDHISMINCKFGTLKDCFRGFRPMYIDINSCTSEEEYSLSDLEIKGEQLERLSIVHCSFKDTSVTVCSYPSLRELTLSDCRITEVKLGMLPALEKLALDHNLIRAVEVLSSADNKDCTDRRQEESVHYTEEVLDVESLDQLALLSNPVQSSIPRWHPRARTALL